MDLGLIVTFLHEREKLISFSISKQASIERRRMSKRLTDDALAYFDECVSLSTFDGSDFSSLEETPPIHQASSTTQVEDGTTPQVSSKCFPSLLELLFL